MEYTVKITLADDGRDPECVCTYIDDVLLGIDGVLDVEYVPPVAPLAQLAAQAEENEDA